VWLIRCVVNEVNDVNRVSGVNRMSGMNRERVG
jgi:hypothetical protein